MATTPGRFSYLPIAGLLLLTLLTLMLLSAATQNINELGRLYSVLVLLSLLVVIGMLTLITRNLLRLLRQLRNKQIGSRLTLRMVTLFVLLAVTPALLVFGFAQQFLRTGIDSWFDARVADALDDALELSQAALEQGMRIRLKRTMLIAGEMNRLPVSNPELTLDAHRQAISATELTLWDNSGSALLSSNTDPLVVTPARPQATLVARVRHGDPYVGLEPNADGGLLIRILMRVPRRDGVLLYATFPVSERIGRLAQNVEGAYDRYQELAYLRGPLKFSFTLTLALILLLSVLGAVWVAFISSARLVAPISDLAEGTRAVAEGNYDTRLPATRNDELGLLVRSFNDMTSRISRARSARQRSEQQAIAQRSYLETVLKHLSSGVLTLDSELRLRTCNPASTQVLGLDLEHCLTQNLEEMSTQHPRLLPLAEAIVENRGNDDWSAEIHLLDQEGRPRVLICRGALLPTAAGEADEQVLVFDDVTRLIQAQRDAAWGEVARRLAHEIKNPLTPIQLSAERLQHKYLRKLSTEDGELLKRLTNTIIKQVETMKEMVNAFSEYARSPKVSTRTMDINTLARDVVELYRGHKEIALKLDLAADLPPVKADAGRLRQVFHNLIKNAIEAMDSTDTPTITVSSGQSDSQISMVCVRIADNGPGIPDVLRDKLFEPYVTNKEKGSGLGLAVVKKILEEHGGGISVDSSAENGTRFTLSLPVDQEGRAQQPPESKGPEQ